MSSEPGNKSALFDIVLERLDNGEEVGFILSGGDGRRNEFAISESPYPRNSLQTYQGSAGYDDQEPPYRTLIQQDWTGGMGQLNFESDATRFLLSHNLQSHIGGKMFLSGAPQFASGYLPDLLQAAPGSVKWVKLLTTNSYLSSQVTTGSTGISDATVLLYVRAFGSPGALTVHIYSNTGSQPNASLGSVSITTSDVPRDHGVLYKFQTGVTLSTSTVYHIVVTAASDDADDYWEVGTNDSGVNSFSSSNGSSWASDADAPYWVLWDSKTTGNVRDYIPFTYKNQAYVVKRFEDKANSFLFIAGDRGAADSNSGDLTLLNDASKSWTTDEWAGYTVLITAGPGAEEEQPWRTISSNTGTALTCDVDWKVAHTTSTEYVILSDAFTSNLDLGGHVTDIALAGDFIYFARGESTNILRYQAFNNGGTWTERNDAENVAGTFLLAQREPDGDEFLWVAKNEDASLGVHVRRLNVPVGWGDLYQIEKTVASTRELWTDYVQPSVTASVVSPDIAKFATNLGATGLVASKNLAAPIDAREASRIGTHVRITGTVPTVTLGLSDTRVEDKKFQAQKFLRSSSDYRLPASVLLVASYTPPAGMKHYDGTSDWDSLGNATIGDTQYAVKFDIAGTSDRIYIGSAGQFNEIQINMGGTVNAQSATMTGKIWDGNAWVDASITDGTASGGATLAVDGSVTWTVSNFPYWVPGSSDDGTNLDTSLYWFELSFSANLDATLLLSLLLMNSTRGFDTVSTTAMTRAADADDGNAHLIPLFSPNDWLYVMGVDPFDEIKIDFGVVNATASCTLAAEYFDGEEFVSVSNLSDGTASGGTAFAQDGSVTFNLPDDMSLITVNSTEGYCVRLRYTQGSSLDMTTDITIVEAAVRNRREPAYYELSGALVGQRSTAATANEDGSVVSMASGDYLYVCGSNRFDTMSFIIDGTTKNAQSQTLTGYYWDGKNWTAFASTSDGTISSGASLAVDGDYNFSTGTDLMQRSTINGVTGYWVRLQATGNFDDALIHAISLQRANEIAVTLSGPTVSAGLWYYLDGAISLFAAATQKGIDLSNIQSVNLSVTVSLPTAIEIRGGVLLVNQDGFFINGFGPNSDRITGMELYGQGRQNPWVFTEGGVYEIQTQLGNDVAPLPLGELPTLKSPLNGRASTTSDTYLIFNWGAHTQRYFNQTLDNIGPNREEGFPSNRNGYPVFYLASPGGIYEGKDGGDSGYSELMFGQSRAWGTTWMAPKGLRIRQGAIQPVVGSALDRLWVSVGPLLLYIPIPSETFDPTKDSNYLYSPEGSLITSWMSAGLFTLDKLWKQISLFTENLTSNITVRVSYQKETGDWDGAWTKLTDDFDASPIEDHDIALLMVNARRIRFRISLRTNDQTTTPIVYAFAVDALIWFPVKWSYTFQHRISNQDEMLHGIKRKGLIASSWVSVLNDLATNKVACRVHSKTYPLMDGKIVVVEPSGKRRIPSTGEKAYIMETTLLEV